MMLHFKNSVGVHVLVLVAFACWINAETTVASGTFGFDVHHRYSDTVKDFLDIDGLPEKGTVDYFAAMAHRDQLFKDRRLATAPSSSSVLTFFGDSGNQTYRLRTLGYLHYAIVTVGTPPVSFIVALDTSTDLFWLPCDCTNCIRSWNSTSGELPLKIYSPSTSNTSSLVQCNSPMCGRRGCSLTRNACAYQETYYSNTSSSGILVDDILHLGTDSSPQSLVEAPITFGCGMTQTGDFLDFVAVNGLLGLGMGSVSVPSILANKKLAANSFSMCFGPDGRGRIEFGDKGTADQKVTPFNLQQLNPTYNITVTQVVVAKNITNVQFTAAFDTSTSFTYLNDPAYSFIVENFDSQITEPRYQPPRKIRMDYCYALSATQETYNVPSLSLTMKGGNKYYVTAPTIVIPRQGGYAYCLAVVKSENINIIGQNFMTGNRIVFDREEMVLGWKESDCYDSISPDSGSNTPPAKKPNSTDLHPPPTALDPPANRTRIPFSSSPPPQSTRPLFGSDAARLNLNSISYTVTLIIILSTCLHHLVILS